MTTVKQNREVESMEELKTAIIEDGAVRCPVCGAVNGRVSGNEIVINYKIRCRKSKKNNDHYFLLFAGDAENLKTIGGGSKS